MITLGLGCAPVLGGLLTELSWRLIFFVNIPVGAGGLALVLIRRKDFHTADAPTAFDAELVHG